MRTLKRLGTGVLAVGVAAAGMLMSAPIASAHTGTLATSAVCNDDGTYQITYAGKTTGVPESGRGHRATLLVGEVKPADSTITDVPPTVTGNTTYSFHQVVAGTATHAQATAFLTWGDGATSDPIGKIDLPGNCTPPTPVAPSGDLTTDCVEGGGQVVASHLDSGTAENVTWQLVSGTEGSHHKVEAGPNSSGSLEVGGLGNGISVWLQYSTGNGFVDEGAVVTTGDCTPPVVNPSGSFTVVCSETGADVTIGTLDSGDSEQDVVWTLSYGTQATTVNSADLVAVPALAALALKYTVGGGESHTVQSGTAPESCGTTGDGSLKIVKSVTPTGDAAFGDTLTYTLKVTAGGSLGQTGVVVTDDIPSLKSGRDSGTTTYVPGSAACDAGTCTAVYDAAANLVTWSLGDMAPGTSRTVTFQVVIDTPANLEAGVPAVTIYNSAAVRSTETPSTPSNEVQTPVTAVLAVRHSSTPDDQPTAVLGSTLPHTGAPGQLPWTLAAAALFLVMGSSLILVARRPEVARVR
jgi:uncharacterized repeat protein (TIGR01451 family)